MSNVIFDEILGKLRSADVSGGTGGGGTEYIGGFAIGISGDTISRLRYMSIESVTGNSVTLQAGHAYKAYATSTAITLNTETVPEGQFGMEGHIEIYVAGAGYVVTGTNVVLANALEPDSVNNCTLRFHDGVCIISVEDHVAGYIVVNGATSGEGSLAYGISTSTNDYVAFDASLNGQVIPLAGAVAEGEKHIVGNGYNETTLTGAVDCGTSKFTVANLALSDVQVTGGVMTLGDAFIPSGSTVEVSGGGLAVEKVTGAGDASVIDLGGTQVSVYNTANTFSGVSITGGNGGNGGALNVQAANGVATFTSCTISGNTGSTAGGGLAALTSGTLNLSACIVSSNYSGNGGGIYDNAVCSMTDCIITGNTGYGGAGVYVNAGAGRTLIASESVISGNIDRAANKSDLLVGSGAVATLTGCTVGNIDDRGTLNLSGYAGVDSVFNSGTVTLTSGAILDLTGNTNPTPIAPGGGITFEQGGATVLYGTEGNVSSCFIGGATFTGYIDNAGGVGDPSGNFIFYGADVIMSGLTVNTTSRFYPNQSMNLRLVDVTTTGTALMLGFSPTITIAGTYAGGFIYNANYNNGWYGTVVLEDGAILDLTLDTRNAGIYYAKSITIGVGCKLKISGGAPIDLTPGTYTSATLNADGTITEA